MTIRAPTPATSTVISLREYVDIRFEAQEKAVNAALAAAQKAVDKAETAAEQKFESVNEFRAALSDSSRLNLPRTEFEQVHRTLSDKIDELATRLNARDNRGEGMSQVWVVIVAALALVASIVGIFVALNGGGA